MMTAYTAVERAMVGREQTWHSARMSKIGSSEQEVWETELRSSISPDSPSALFRSSITSSSPRKITEGCSLQCSTSPNSPGAGYPLRSSITSNSPRRITEGFSSTYSTSPKSPGAGYPLRSSITSNSPRRITAGFPSPYSTSPKSPSAGFPLRSAITSNSRERISKALSAESSSPGGTRRSALEGRLVQRLGQTLRERHLLRPGQRILVAVSGGQDSSCLMHMLVQLQRSWGWELGVAHCDHQWSSSSRRQASHVADMAHSMGLDYYQAVTTSPVPGEGAARAWRYGVLHRIAVSHDYEAVVTAHTASDRVETLLFNVFRGTGLQGLQSLTWKRALAPQQQEQEFPLEEEGLEQQESGRGGVELVRPLLDVTRTELRELGRELELPLWPDPSNHSLAIHRNRIRHQLLPYLRKHFNPGVDKSLARWAEILQAEQEYLRALCESIRGNAESEYYHAAAAAGKEAGRSLDISLLRSLPIALQRRVLKQFSDGFTGKSLGFDIVERVRRACVDVSSAKKDLQVSVPGGYRLHIRGNSLIVARGQELQN